MLLDCVNQNNLHNKVLHVSPVPDYLVSSQSFLASVSYAMQVLARLHEGLSLQASTLWGLQVLSFFYFYAFLLLFICCIHFGQRVDDLSRCA